MTNLYVDVAAIRIQSYLARSRHLWGWRGASDGLTKATATATVTELARRLSSELGLLISRPPDAPHIDGVLSLQVTPAPPDAEREATGRRIAVAAARHISAGLPAIHLAATAQVHSTYLQARMTADDSAQLFEWFPPPFEYPLAQRCHECQQDAAIVELPDDLGRVCIDCQRRWLGGPVVSAAARRSAMIREEPRVGSFSVEAELRDHLRATYPARSQADRPVPVADFSELGELTTTSRHRNHLATIAADGNGLGELFRRARESTPDSAAAGDRMTRLSAEVKKAAQDAVNAAGRAVYEAVGGPRIPVIPHVRGGDDVLVSVTADQAWLFARTLARSFGAARGLQAVVGELDLPAPTLSMGMVISRADLPFGDQVQLAERVLRQAKKDVAGQRASILWVDTTAEGRNLVPGRTAWTVADFDDAAPHLTEFLSLSPSARQTLLRDVDLDDPVAAQDRLRARLRRLEPDARAVVLALLGSLRTPPGVTAETQGTVMVSAPASAPQCRQLLRDALSIARWWS